MEVRTLVFADDDEAKPRLYACGKCGAAVSPKYFGGGEAGHEEALRRAGICCLPPPPEVEKACACGAKISKWSSSCADCQTAAIVAKAEVITDEPDILVIVGTDSYFQSVEEAAEQFPGAWAHPCESTPLTLNPESMAGSLVERAVENMCEEAFEDAEDHVNGTQALHEAFEAALVNFNAAQTASRWQEDVSKVFKLPNTPADSAEAA